MLLEHRRSADRELGTASSRIPKSPSSRRFTSLVLLAPRSNRQSAVVARQDGSGGPASSAEYYPIERHHGVRRELGTYGGGFGLCLEKSAATLEKPIIFRFSTRERSHGGKCCWRPRPCPRSCCCSGPPSETAVRGVHVGDLAW